MKILLTVMSNVANDPRVMKYYEYFSKLDYDVNVLGFNQKLNDKYIEKNKHIYFTGKSVLVDILGKVTYIMSKLKLDSRWQIIKIINNVIYFAVIRSFNRSVYKFIKRNIRYCDIIHTHDLSCLIGPAQHKNEAQCILIYDSHELWTEMSGEFSLPFKKIMSHYENKYIKNADYLITVCEPIARELKKKYKTENFDIIYNAPDFTYIDIVESKQKSAQMKKEYNIPQETKIILYLGRYELGRGLIELIEAMKYVKNGILFMRGYGRMEGELRSYVINKKISERVIFLNPVSMEEMVKTSTFADIGIIPYKPVNLNNKFAAPNKLFEYMMAGLAIVAFRSEITEKMIMQTDTGEVFDNHSPTEIARAINRIIDNQDRMQLCRKNAVLIAANKYNWENQMSKLKEFLRDHDK